MNIHQHFRRTNCQTYEGIVCQEKKIIHRRSPDSHPHLSSPIQLSCLPKDFARRLTLEPSVGTSWGFKKNLVAAVPIESKARLGQVPGTPCFGKPGFNMFQSGSANQFADLGTGGEIPVLRTKFWKPGLGTGALEQDLGAGSVNHQAMILLIRNLWNLRDLPLPQKPSEPGTCPRPQATPQGLPKVCRRYMLRISYLRYLCV